MRNNTQNYKTIIVLVHQIRTKEEEEEMVVVVVVVVEV